MIIMKGEIMMTIEERLEFELNQITESYELYLKLYEEKPYDNFITLRVNELLLQKTLLERIKGE